jgi:hypothetical protein
MNKGSDDPFADFRATPDKVWNTLLSIHGEARDMRAYQEHLAGSVGRIEADLRSMKRTVQIGIVLAVILAALAVLR